ALACLLLRLLLAPLADGYARGAATGAALSETNPVLAAAQNPFGGLGGWLAWDWRGTLLGSEASASAVRDAFVAQFVRLMALAGLCRAVGLRGLGSYFAAA